MSFNFLKLVTSFGPDHPIFPGLETIDPLHKVELLSLLIMPRETTSWSPGSIDQSQTTQATILDEPSLHHREAELFRGVTTRVLDRAIEKCIRKRAELNRTQNNSTRALGPEALSLIFQYLCSLHDPRTSYEKVYGMEAAQGTNTHPLIIIGSVSSLWRQAAYSNPQLWNFIDLNIYFFNAHKTAQLLCLFFKKSAELPLTLKLRFINSPEISGPEYLVHSTVDPLIMDNLSRIQCLELLNPPSKWHAINPHLFNLIKFSVSTDHRLGFDVSHGNLSFLSNSRHIRQLELQFHSIPVNPPIRIWVPCDALTSLSLLNISIPSCIDLLVQCPNLVEFKSKTPILPRHLGRNNVIFPEFGSIVHQNLKIFHWGLYNDPSNDRFLQSNSFPSLQNLAWSTPTSFNVGNQIVCDIFLKHLPPTLSTLELHSTIFPGYVRELFEDPNIEHLILSDLAPRTVSGVLRKQPGKNIFPGLKRLTIRFSPSLPYPKFALDIARMLEALHLHQHGRRFCLETIFWSWTDDDKNILKLLVDCGMRLEVIENFQPVSWL